MPAHSNDTKKETKPGRGGKREGAGRPAIAKVAKKKNYTIRLYQDQVKQLKNQYGSIQKAIDSL